ncbi:hypothetical protein WICPIJ_009684, partial [Wickerhamomyces pijperi]
YEDWDLIQIHAGMMEFTIIQQSRGLCQGQEFVYFVPGSGVSVLMKVVKLLGVSDDDDDDDEKEVQFGIFASNTEISVAPKTRQQANSTKPIGKKPNGLKEEKPISVLRRGVSFKDEKQLQGFEIAVSSKCEILNSFNNYVLVSLVPSPSLTSSPSNNSQESPSEDPLPFAKRIVARIVPLPTSSISINEVRLSPLLASSLSCFDQIGTLLKLTSISKSKLSKSQGHGAQGKVIKVHKLITQSPAGSKQDLQERKVRLGKIREQMNELFNEDVMMSNSPLTSGSKFPDLKQESGLFPKGFLLKLASETGFVLNDNGKVAKWDFEIGEDLLVPESQVPQCLNAGEQKQQQQQSAQLFIGQDQLLAEILSKIQSSSSSSSLGLLITGASGSGKSTLIQTIVKRLSSFSTQPYHTITVDVATLAKLPFAQLSQQLTQLLTSAIWHSPTLMLMESIESLFPSESEQGDSSQQRQLIEWFLVKWNELTKDDKVVLIGSARSKDSLHPLLTSSHLISETYQLKPPSKSTREDLILTLLKTEGIVVDSSFDLSKLSAETEGYSLKDLYVLTERILHEIIYQSTQMTATGSVKHLTTQTFNDSIKDFTPSSLRGIKLAKPTASLTWSSIGGLTEAKTLLLETLEWPTKYAPIFKSATLRLRSGVLLYGHPGCGKTLLASAVASQCGLNFISVKGPEILNKYIGASEQSIRDLFDRASAAKPCILFFDEFDSIAPKRGADSTGVTDRVVNQMLTQMDGAEGLDGVYVLAATSRPDLIDSALLRPGRLDKAVLCGMPTLLEIEDILRCVTETMSLCEDVDLSEIAKGCLGFSGADLQAVGYNAYLRAVNRKLDEESKETEQEQDEQEGVASKKGSDVHEFFQLSFNRDKMTNLKPSERNKINQQIKLLIESPASERKQDSQNPETTEEQISKPELMITQADLLASLAETKPSISQSEMFKLNNIYAKFDDTNEREADMHDGEGDHDTIGGRVTLA